MAKMTKHSKNIKDLNDLRESNKINHKDSHKSTTDLSLNHCDSHNLDSCDMDCFGESCDSPRNDEVVDSRDSRESSKIKLKDSFNPRNPHDSRYSNDKDSKDSTATRILLIIRALCNGASLDSLTLKDFDFNISKRTFQRDIKKIKDFFVENIAYVPMQGIDSPNIHSQSIATANLTANPNTNPNKITKTLKGGGELRL